MTRTIATTAKAALVAATIALTAMAVPAQAGGSFSIGFAPSDPDQKMALQAGMAFYALAKGIEDGSITQNGSGNMAGIAQNGSGNLGIVHQEGDGHKGTIEQNGNNNSCALFQFGEGTDGQCVQNGNGQAGATFQFGW